jgi:signal transduction histidine kinase
VFDRFYRVDGARSHTHGGSGLGLAIAKSLVEAHSGTLDVESVVGCGSTFTIRMPAAHNDLITGGSLPEEM